MKRLLTLAITLILFGLTVSEAYARAVYVNSGRSRGYYGRSYGGGGYGYGRSYYGGGYGYRRAYYGGGYGYGPYYGYRPYPYYGGYYSPYYYSPAAVVVNPYYYGYPSTVFVGGPGFGIGINAGY